MLRPMWLDMGTPHRLPGLILPPSSPLQPSLSPHPTQVRYVSDFFKQRSPPPCTEDPERKPSLPLTPSDPDRNHYSSYRGGP